MAKNMTRKGLALGAATALAVSGLSALPASANGLLVSGYVTLAPASGAEYNVLTGTSKEFILASNGATAAIGTGKYFKFLVEDASGTLIADQSDANDGAVFNGTPKSTLYEVESTAWAEAAGVAAVTVASHKFKTGDRISFDTANDTLVTGVVLATSDATTVRFEKTAGGTPATEAGILRLLPNSASNGSFVYQTREDGNSTNKVLVLETASGETLARTAKVTAWIDNNNNDTIDGSEYVSEVRTVNWLTPSSLTITTVMDPVIVGATSLTGYATTDPVLNGAYVAAADVNADFTRPGSAQTETDTTGSWSATTKRWSFSQTLVPASGVWDDLKNFGIVSVSESTTTLTVDTASSHGLTTGDTVVISGVTDTDGTDGSSNLNGIFTATRTDADTFTVTITAGTYTEGVSNAWVGVQDAVAGDYSIKAIFDNAQVDANSKTATYSTAAVKVSSLVASVTTGTGISAAGDIRKGVKSVTVSAVAKDVDGAVLSGRLVKVEVKSGSTLTGTHYFNGTKLTAAGDFIYVTTDASGLATVTVTSDTAAASDNLDIDFSSEGVTATTVNLDWENSTYVIYETTEGGTALNTRTMNKGGSYTLNLAVVDQWGGAIDSATYRLLVTASNKQVFSTPFTLTAGRASVTLNDAGLAGNDVTASVVLQKLSSGTWSTSSDPSLSRTFTVNVIDQTDKILLDAQNSTAFGNATADLDDNITTDSITAVADARLDNKAVFNDSTNLVVVSGRVANSSTNVGRAGSTVTLSGPADILFVAGNKSGFGSVTFVADANGEFSASLFTNKAQKDTVITATSGAASLTTKVTFAVTNNSGADAFVVTAPTSVKPGSTFTVKVKLVDKFGNGLDTAEAGDNAGNGKVAITYTGPGIVFGTLPKETDANGEASFAVLLGTNDSGTATIAANYDYDGTGTTYKSVAVSKTVVVGTVAGVAGTSVKRTGNTVAVRVTGAKTRIVFNGVRVASRTTDGVLTRTLTLRAGRNVIQIVVDGTVIRTVRYTR
jgi:hypothetical protein